MISRFVPAPTHVLGTDGYGLSDIRPALRRHFEIDADHIVVAALAALADEGRIEAGVVAEAIKGAGIDPDAGDPARR